MLLITSHRQLSVMSCWTSVMLCVALIPTAIPHPAAAATIAVVNQSSITSASDAPFSATIRAARYGPELVVTGAVGERTTTGVKRSRRSRKDT